jgi:hypothetical protein
VSECVVIFGVFFLHHCDSFFKMHCRFQRVKGRTLVFQPVENSVFHMLTQDEGFEFFRILLGARLQMTTNAYMCREYVAENESCYSWISQKLNVGLISGVVRASLVSQRSLACGNIPWHETRS